MPGNHSCWLLTHFFRMFLSDNLRISPGFSKHFHTSGRSLTLPRNLPSGNCHKHVHVPLKKTNWEEHLFISKKSDPILARRDSQNPYQTFCLANGGIPSFSFLAIFGDDRDLMSSGLIFWFCFLETTKQLSAANQKCDYVSEMTGLAVCNQFFLSARFFAEVQHRSHSAILVTVSSQTGTTDVTITESFLCQADRQNKNFSDRILHFWSFCAQLRALHPVWSERTDNFVTLWNFTPETKEDQVRKTPVSQISHTELTLSKILTHSFSSQFRLVSHR